MKMWEVRSGAVGQLFVFDHEGRLKDTRKAHRVTEDRQFSDGEVLDFVHVHNNERQGLSTMGFFPRHLYPAPQRMIIEAVTRDQGAAFISKGKNSGFTYVLVLPRGAYECLC